MKTPISLTLLALLFMGSCNENPTPPDPYDPCEYERPISADFLILENVGDSLVATDSVLLYSFVTFRAKGYATSYRWKIGEDERVFTDRKVQLRFLDDAVGEIIVQLIVEGTPNTKCFPTDNGTDTVEYTFHVVEWGDAPIIGKYEGYFESNPAKKDEIVELKYTSPQEDPKAGPFGSFELYNINKGCNMPKTHEMSVWARVQRGARAFRFDANYAGEVNNFYNCDAPNAWLSLNGSDTLVVDFSYSATDRTVRIDDKYIGIKKTK